VRRKSSCSAALTAQFSRAGFEGCTPGHSRKANCCYALTPVHTRVQNGDVDQLWVTWLLECLSIACRVFLLLVFLIGDLNCPLTMTGLEISLSLACPMQCQRELVP
jgi:hypothetical protein